jgi:arabinose-5-phosphate isomerase
MTRPEIKIPQGRARRGEPPPAELLPAELLPAEPPSAGPLHGKALPGQSRNDRGAKVGADPVASTSRPGEVAAACAIGAEVLRTEAAALISLAEGLGDDFAAAVAAVLKVSGRVVCSGMGKSGHVARKIAATLASTGTPAHFVHPAEAAHGDLGMIAPGDLCLLLSNSGETAELGAIVAYTRRFGIALIGVSKDPASSLMRAADIALVLPDAPEACAIGMAPTTSTTLMLALGDALAVAVMRARGFSADDFATFHPGGKLGAQMLRVAQVMVGAGALPEVAPDAPMSEVLIEMSARGFGLAAVVDAGRLVGVISDGDLRRNIDGLMGRRARDVATRNPRAIRPEALLGAAVREMNAAKIGVLCVTDAAGELVGMIRLHDCLRAGVV